MNRSGMWHYTAKSPTIFGIDARAFMPTLPLMVYCRVWTLVLMLGSVVFFAVLSWKGLPLPVVYRKCRHKLCGNTRAARPWWYWRRFRVPTWKVRAYVSN